MFVKRSLIAATLLVLTSAAQAAERSYSSPDFDAVRIYGAFNVIVETGKRSSTRAIGSAQALDRISVEARGKTLVIKPLRLISGGWPGRDVGPVTIRITTRLLNAANLDGAGSLSINKMIGARLSLINSGSGTVTVSSIDADNLSFINTGSGNMSLSGKSLLAKGDVSGSGSVNGAALLVGDLTLTVQSSGTVNLHARRTAKVTSSGSGVVEIAGSPACTVNALGSGTVKCGAETP
jgi:hypothetical protein